MTNDPYTESLVPMTRAILDAVEGAVQHDHRLAGRSRREVLAAMIAAASCLAFPDPHFGDGPIPLEADLHYTYAARQLTRSGTKSLAALLYRTAQVLIEPGGAESSPQV
jgi:hypothetical protein